MGLEFFFDTRFGRRYVLTTDQHNMYVMLTIIFRIEECCYILHCTTDQYKMYLISYNVICHSVMYNTT